MGAKGFGNLFLLKCQRMWAEGESRSRDGGNAAVGAHPACLSSRLGLIPNSFPEDLIWVHPTHITLSLSCREAGMDLSPGNAVVSGMKSLGGKCHEQSCSWLSFPGEREMEKKRGSHPRNSESWNSLGWKRPGSNPLPWAGPPSPRKWAGAMDFEKNLSEMAFLADPSNGRT